MLLTDMNVYTKNSRGVNSLTIPMSLKAPLNPMLAVFEFSMARHGNSKINRCPSWRTSVKRHCTAAVAGH